MKNAVLILLFICSRIVCQVGPPSLRCLEVQQSGDIKLTWIAPSDPSGTFFAYEIYSSQTQFGTYTLVTTIPSIVTNTYTETGAGGNSQSKYYYMLSRFGAAGASSSSHSDTLRSMFLNIITGIPELKLNYNNIHQPKLSTSAGAFTINKEYPLGTWNILGTTAGLKYNDTISVCSASINYQVTLPDASGCVSSSNLQGGVYNDKKNPNTPVIDSISVLPNGQTVLAWVIPYDKDIIDYIIYHNVGTNVPIDTVKGINNTSYTYTTPVANMAPLQVYVSAIDSCLNPGGFDIQPTTMFLKATYDKCAYQSVLTWNAYQGMRNGVLEYRIYYSVNGSTPIRIGATTQTTYTHNNVSPAQNITYFVRVINTSKTITASSNRVTFFSNQVPAAGYIYTTKASVTSKNSVDLGFYIDTSKTSVGIDVMRSLDGINFSFIGYLQANGTPFYSFTDDQADTKNKFYFYKAIIKDSCGNARTNSNVVKTVLLKVEDDKEKMFTKHLTWTQYQGFGGGVSGYNIYRVINDVKQSSPVGYTGPTDSIYTDIIEDEASNGSKIEYLVEAVEGLGNIYPFQENCYSNTAIIYLEGKIFVPSAFAPKGKNRVWLPVTHFVDKQEYTVTVFNRWGAKVFETSDDTQGWTGDNHPPDVYVYLIRYKNSLGEYKELKGTVLMME